MADAPKPENGVRGVSAELVRQGAEATARPDPEQLAMFEVPKGERVDAAAARDERIAQRGPGRPKGAQNLSTRQWREFLLARGFMPQMEMMRWGMLSPEELAERLGCKKIEAMHFLKSLWEGLSPYFMPRLAPTDDAGNVAPQIAMFIGANQVNAGGDGARPPWMRAFDEMQQLQRVSEGDGAASEAASSEAGEKP